MFPSRFFPDRYYAPRYWPKVGANSGAAATPTRRFSISRQSTRFTADNPGNTFHGTSQRRTHSTDGSGNVFTDSSGNRFSGDE